MDVVLLAGTRPEAVKLAPLALTLSGRTSLNPMIVHSGQHDGMVEQALTPFGVPVRVWLEVPPRRTGGQAELVAGLLPALDRFLRQRRPAAVVVQGDTTTALAGALAAFWIGIPVVHLEAGLRTHDLRAPFPEEGTRQMVARLACLHLAPTPVAAAALRDEGVPAQRIVVTGNTVVDAARQVAGHDRPAMNPDLALLRMEVTEVGERLVLVTAHRRESWGEPFIRILTAVRGLVDDFPDVQVLFPAHPNPILRSQARDMLSGVSRVTVTDPLDYPDLILALRLASLVLTDSSGIQEEAPSFGTPVLVLREITEHPEMIDGGHARLVGTDPRTIRSAARDALCGRPGWAGWLGRRRAPAAGNPYGDGRAAERAAAAIAALLDQPHTVPAASAVSGAAVHRG